jgi:hypothetical protein
MNNCQSITLYAVADNAGKAVRKERLAVSKNKEKDQNAKAQRKD